MEKIELRLLIISLKVKIFLDYLGGRNVVKSVLKCGKDIQRDDNERRTLSDVVALKMEERSHKSRKEAALEVEKARKWIVP